VRVSSLFTSAAVKSVFANYKAINRK